MVNMFTFNNRRISRPVEFNESLIQQPQRVSLSAVG